MKETFIKKLTSNPFKEILHSQLVTKAQSGLNDLVTGVKKIFGHTDPAAEKQPDEINNYLKSPAEIEAELQLMASSEYDYKPLPQSFGSQQQIEKLEISGQVKSIEEALAGEMEENY